MAIAPEGRGGFVTVRTPHAEAVMQDAYAAGVHLDSRGPFLRFGPAPYLSDAQIDEAMTRVGHVLRARPHRAQGEAAS